MLPGGLDLMYRNALATSHTAYFRVDILDGQQNVLIRDVVYLAGNVSATLTSRVARTCDVTFTEDMYPYLSTGLLAPYGNMIRAVRGIEFADGSRFAWTVFIGRIQETRLSADGTCVAYAADFATDVVDAKFVSPESSSPDILVTEQMKTLIFDGFSQATFGASDDSAVETGALTWQSDRGAALDELGASIGFFWYPLANGDFVLRRYPWTIPPVPVVTYSDDEGGSVVSSSATRTRQDIYNTLTVTGERLNGEPPVYGIALDDNPASPTFIDGNFGVRHQLMRLQTPGTQGSAQDAASDNLRRLIALTDSWEWEMAPDAALELGDAVNLAVRGRPPIIQVVESMSIPLDVKSVMRVRGRTPVIGVLEGVE